MNPRTFRKYLVGDEKAWLMESGKKQSTVMLAWWYPQEIGPHLYVYKRRPKRKDKLVKTLSMGIFIPVICEILKVKPPDSYTQPLARLHWARAQFTWVQDALNSELSNAFEKLVDEELKKQCKQ